MARIWTLILASWISADIVLAGDSTNGFGIYLLAGPAERRLISAGEGDWKHVALAAEPIISDEEISSYEWNSHTLVLGEKAKRIRFPKVPVSGVPFVVMVGGERLYLGALVTRLSSISFAVPCVAVDPELSSDSGRGRLVIQRAYPTPAFGKGPDPRGDERVKSFFAKIGKLDRGQTADPD